MKQLGYLGVDTSWDHPEMFVGLKTLNPLKTTVTFPINPGEFTLSVHRNLAIHNRRDPQLGSQVHFQDESWTLRNHELRGWSYHLHPHPDSELQRTAWRGGDIWLVASTGSTSNITAEIHTMGIDILCKEKVRHCCLLFEIRDLTLATPPFRTLQTSTYKLHSDSSFKAKYFMLNATFWEEHDGLKATSTHANPLQMIHNLTRRHLMQPNAICFRQWSLALLCSDWCH